MDLLAAKSLHGPDFSGVRHFLDRFHILGRAICAFRVNRPVSRPIAGQALHHICSVAEAAFRLISAAPMNSGAMAPVRVTENEFVRRRQ
ncbi:hypothetical protein [Brevirhabdus pacifica]|uniref:hypothetical protein n=1 Tax=Brevirhabdus pacifica TaxID=1267768 RepID=UPI00117CB240|nr:hypothetical protein [Brevirhabdus pacifica]